jgi:hypothetical protein
MSGVQRNLFCLVDTWGMSGWRKRERGNPGSIQIDLKCAHLAGVGSRQRSKEYLGNETLGARAAASCRVGRSWQRSSVSGHVGTAYELKPVMVLESCSVSLGRQWQQ